MKNMTRMICLLLCLAALLCACQTEQAPTTGNPTTVPPTTQPTGPDFTRALPVLTEKFVTDTPGEGDLVLAKAQDVLKAEYPEFKMQVNLPDEKSRRVGQSVAAASLPKIK
jgi:hypothetical protein